MKKKTELTTQEEVIEPNTLTDLFKTARRTIEKYDNDEDEILEGARTEVKLLKQILLELKRINRKLDK